MLSEDSKQTPRLLARNIDEIIVHTIRWSGFEKLINSMIPPLVDR